MDFDISRRQSPSLVWSTLPSVIAFTVVVIIIYFAHAFVGPTEIQYDPKSCTAAPFACWDAHSKFGFPSCTKLNHPTTVRGVLYKPGEQICYKSIYFNVERTSLIIAIIFLFWALITIKSVERLADCVLNNRTRPLFALATLLEIPAIWYSCSVLIHYYNDSFFDFFYSQLYYSLTEVAIYLTATYLLDSSVRFRYRNIASIIMGTAIYHMIQLNMDEPLLIFSRNPLRNILLFLPDLLTTINLLKIHPPVKRDGAIIVASVLGNFLAFQLFFADKASLSIASYKILDIINK